MTERGRARWVTFRRLIAMLLVVATTRLTVPGLLHPPGDHAVPLHWVISGVAVVTILALIVDVFRPWKHPWPYSVCGGAWATYGVLVGLTFGADWSWRFGEIVAAFVVAVVAWSAERELDPGRRRER